MVLKRRLSFWVAVAFTVILIMNVQNSFGDYHELSLVLWEVRWYIYELKKSYDFDESREGVESRHQSVIEYYILCVYNIW